MAKKVLKELDVDAADDQNYFVSIGNPTELRKNILESSKKAIYCLQNYQRILLLRQKKQAEMEELRTSLKELLYLNKKFNEKLPKYKVEILHDPKKISKESDAALKQEVPKVKQEKVKEVKPPKAKAPPRQKTELEKLEESLAAIESKLSNIDAQ